MPRPATQRRASSALPLRWFRPYAASGFYWLPAGFGGALIRTSSTVIPIIGIATLMLGDFVCSMARNHCRVRARACTVLLASARRRDATQRIASAGNPSGQESEASSLALRANAQCHSTTGICSGFLVLVAVSFDELLVCSTRSAYCTYKLKRSRSSYITAAVIVSPDATK